MTEAEPAPCTNHADSKTRNRCEACGAPICARCIFGGTGRMFCRPCYTEKPGGAGGGIAWRLPILIVAMPVLVCGIGFLLLATFLARRGGGFAGVQALLWDLHGGGLAGMSWAVAPTMFLGAGLLFLLLYRGAGMELGLAAGLVFLSFCAAMVRFVMSAAKRLT